MFIAHQLCLLLPQVALLLANRKVSHTLRDPDQFRTATVKPVRVQDLGTFLTCGKDSIGPVEMVCGTIPTCKRNRPRLEQKRRGRTAVIERCLRWLVEPQMEWHLCNNGTPSAQLYMLIAHVASC